MKKDDFNYKEPKIELFLKVVGCIAVIGYVLFWLFSLASCNPVKKAYEGVAKYDAITTKDSANFYSRAKKMIKTPPPIIKEGKTIRVPYPVEKIKKVIDPIALQNIVDSLGIAHAEDLNNAVDDCMTSVKKARNEGVKAGYAQANYENYINGKEVRVDTNFFADQSTVGMLDDCQQKLRVSQSETIKATTQRDIFKGQSKDKNIWLIILAVALGVSGFFNVKKLFSGSSILNTIKKS